jgi:hypothetical protein
MPPRRRSADLRSRREDLGIRLRDMTAGLGIRLGRLLTMEDGTASEEDKTDVAQPHRRLVRRRKASPVRGREHRPPVQMTPNKHCGGIKPLIQRRL